MRFLTSDIAAAVDGTLVGPDVEVDEARHDSRDVVGGELFVPVQGLRDGHDFIGAALEAGAAAYLTARAPVGGTAVVVDDPASALRALAMAARRRLPPRVVGITGSVGKTSAKDLTASVLGRQWLTSASLRSFNNELGVPLTLVNAADGTEALVAEMGARGHGHIAELCAVAQPTVGIVTAVELVHAEMFGDLASVARAKAELVESLPASGTAVLNGANPWVADMAERTEADVLTFGAHDADVRAEDVFVDRALHPSFRLCTPWGDTQVELRVRGLHQVGNALAAAAAGLVCDVELADVAAGLVEAELSPWRMELHTAPSGAVIINDAYNAGPASVEAALRSLVHLEARRHLAVLGPMAELGHHGPEAHRAIGELVGELGVEAVAVDAPDYGLPDVADVDEALSRLGELGTGDALLVKGSRVAGLERLVHRLLET
ncbi:MAG: UDP-N-acetylmuramoyl-tripeptide--D-alanyl-D-alanine ligase [Acidimicrobiales bacterium]|nr:UDP-N-acetylmuramoyl-tripeptide--D-alanyl-D-alanine ligase [Acidimicrobiales bacterium]